MNKETEPESTVSLEDRGDARPMLSVITVNYNGLQDTCELIDSLLSHIYSVTYEIVVVDNASRVDEATLLKKKYPQIIALRSDINLGFSGGNNLGIRNAKGDYLFLMNNDTYVRSDNFRQLIDAINQKPNIAGVSPKILFAEPGNTIQFAGFTPLTKYTLRNSIIGIDQIDDGRWDTPMPTPILHGAAMLFKRSAIDVVGLMPEVYFLYYEELDWSAAFLRAGFELWYIPSSVVYHKGSKSTGAYSTLQVFYMTRNRMLYAWRNLSVLDRWISVIYQILIANTKACFLFLIKRKPLLAKASFRGVKAFLKMDKKA
ncbi:MAG: glycosyltransferase family 2 protein [Bacteroidales bacterium]|nr:glycosyltransferase family 2 protein [Bacteroidales bacterium]